MHLIQHLLGLDSGSGPIYLFWSGFGSDLTEFALLGTLIGVYRHHNCTVKGCPRIAHHPVEGTTFRTCHKHATIQGHKALHKEHSKKYPLQHKLLRYNDTIRKRS